MFANKIKTRQSGILTYGITPPKEGTDPQKVSEIAQKTIARILSLDIDALVLYDVQDESARTSLERPFPYFSAMDPLEYATGYLQQLEVPKIIYRPAGKFSREELTQWVDTLHHHHFYPVFVGVPTNGFEVKTTLPEAYAIWSRYKRTSVAGAVTIPERHATQQDEDKRILGKMEHGVSYFISQCVFNVEYACRLIEDLAQTCLEQDAQVPTIILTLTACGSAKTLHFLEWLGIHLPDAVKEDLHKAENMLERSVSICLEIAAEIIAFCNERQIPFGFNIESVAIRKDEIEASIFMVGHIGRMLTDSPAKSHTRPAHQPG